MRYTLLSTAAALMVGSAAYAGSPVMYPTEPVIYEPMEPISVATDWTGLYFGGLVGLQMGNAEFDNSGILDPFDATTFGAFGGYNWQMNNMVVGGEVAAQMGNGTLDTVFGVAPPVAFDLDQLIDIRARVGRAFDNVLVFAAGGYTFGTVTEPINLVNDPVSGFNLGAGAELAVSDNFFVGGEYIYRNLSGEIAALAPPTVPFDMNSHGFQLRAGFRF